MSKNNRIRVKLNVSTDLSSLEKLKKQLDTISSKTLRPDLEILHKREIATVDRKLERLDNKTLNPKLVIRDNAEAVGAKQQALSKTTTSRHIINEVRGNKVRKKSLASRNAVKDKQRAARSRKKAVERARLSGTQRKQVRRAPGRHPFGGALGGDFNDMEKRIQNRTRTRRKLDFGQQAARRLSDTVIHKQAPVSDTVSKPRRASTGFQKGGGDSQHQTRTGLSRRHNRTRAGVDASNRDDAKNARLQRRIRRIQNLQTSRKLRDGETFSAQRAQKISKRRRRRRNGGLLSRLLGGASSSIMSARSVPGRKNDDDKITDTGLLGKMIPTGRFSRQVSSMIMVALLSIAQAVGGIITAWAGHLTAMAGIVGLGMLGFGETAAQSEHLAKVRTRIFGRELFNEMRPATSHFAPITDQLFQTMPSRLGQLNDTLMDLDTFVPSLDPAIDGTINWIDDALSSMIEFSDEIVELSMRFGSLLGTGIIELFEWLVEGAANSQEAFLEVAEMFAVVIVTALRFAKVWGQVMAVLTPVFKLLGQLAAVLDNDVSIAMLQFLLIVAMLNKVINAVSKAGLFMQGVLASKGWVGAAIAGIKSLTASYWALATSMMGAAKAAALLASAVTLGVGGFLIAGGGTAAMNAMPGLGGQSDMGPSTDFGGNEFTGGGGASGAGAGGAGNHVHYTMNVEGDTDKDSINKFKDMAYQQGEQVVEDRNEANKS